jgi:hypothetical protein
MVESRWLRWIGPGVIALGAVGFIASTTQGAGDRPWAPRACAGQPGDLIAATRHPGPSRPADVRNQPWYRIDPSLDGDGALHGQRLAIGIGGDRARSDAELPPESFAAGPFGRIVLVGSDDGARSQLLAFDVATRCAWPVGEEHDVIRRATIDPAGAGIYETRVDRERRLDLGVWLRPIDGRGPARRILAPLPADVRFGRTFSTEFTWDVDGSRLAVQACGEVACRTRLIAPRGESVVTLDDPDLGVLLGFEADRVVTYGACRGMPCPIVSVDLTTDEHRVLESNGGRAAVVDTADGARLILEAEAQTGRRLRSVALDGTAASDLGPLPDGLDLHPGAVIAGAATLVPDGWVLLALDGRLPTASTSLRPQLRRIPDGITVPLDEAIR